MKAFTLSIILLLILPSCHQNDLYLPEKQKFLFPRCERRFMNRVKNVIETSIDSDTSYLSGEISKTTTIDKYRFSEQGGLSEWISECDGKIDLVLSDNGAGITTTNIISEKITKKEIGTWSEEDTFHILNVKVIIDGKENKTIISKYNSKYNIVSEYYVTPNNEIESYYYKYYNDTLNEVVGHQLSKKYSYAQNIDTVRYFFRRQLQSTSIKYYNQYGDTKKLLVQHQDGSVNETIYDYKYDSKLNWIQRKMISKTASSGQLTLTKRDITYY